MAIWKLNFELFFIVVLRSCYDNLIYNTNSSKSTSAKFRKIDRTAYVKLKLSLLSENSRKSKD